MPRALGDVAQAYASTLSALVAALDAREQETSDHSQRVVRFALAIASKLGLKSPDIDDVGRGALLHDIGKIGVSDAILLKPGPLTPSEWIQMRKHPEIGATIISDIPFLSAASEIVLAHQERWDGNGYPRRLKGEEVPLGARIFAVADTLDAIVSDRPYRRGWAISVRGGSPGDRPLLRNAVRIPESLRRFSGWTSRSSGRCIGGRRLPRARIRPVQPSDARKRLSPEPRPRYLSVMLVPPLLELQKDLGRHLRAGHPWVFRKALADVPKSLPAGTIVGISLSTRSFVARGYLDPHSPIAVRVLTTNPRERIDADFWRARLHRAITLRKELFNDTEVNGYRVTNGEGDFLPGIVVDRYADWAVLKPLQCRTDAVSGDAGQAPDGVAADSWRLRPRRDRSRG